MKKQIIFLNGTVISSASKTSETVNKTNILKKFVSLDQTSSEKAFKELKHVANTIRSRILY